VQELKASGDGWEVAGYASTFGGTPDTYGDIVAKGAFLDSIAKRKTKLLWQHELAKPIGKQLDLKEDDHGLFGRWSILPTTTGKEAHELLKAELVDSMSIGFTTEEADWNEDGTRVLRRIELFEVSLVTIPANASAVITSFKAPDDIPFIPLLRRAQEAVRVAGGEAQALHQRRQASGRSLNDKHLAAIEQLATEVETLLAELRAVMDVSPHAEATAAEIEQIRARLLTARLAAHKRALAARTA
jgi:HK97 family phage prohead protease